MESHARTIDITTHQYYDLVYAFHVFRGNYRKGTMIAIPFTVVMHIGISSNHIVGHNFIHNYFSIAISQNSVLNLPHR